MRNINEMYTYLKENLTSHTLEIKNNIIIAKKKQHSGRFSSFKLRYLKQSNEVSYKSTSYSSITLKFNNDKDLICQLGSVASFKTIFLDYPLHTVLGISL